MDPNHIPTTITATEDQTSKTTTEEPDQANDMGTGRSYECIYCKRGFTTAQALGGHMNIHRKDRVKTKPNAINNRSSKPEPFSHHHSTTLSPSTTSLISTSHHQSFQTYFPNSSSWCLGSSTTSTIPPHDHKLAYVHNNLNDNNTPQVLNMFNENWTNVALASRLSNPNLIDLQDKRSSGNDNDDDDDNNDEELDLELRLGHDR